MFKPTQQHKEFTTADNYSIRVGANAPNNAVNLSYFYNNKLTPNENLVVSEAPMSLVDHITGRHYETITEALTNDDNLFNNIWIYNDLYGYNGILYRNKVDWTSVTKTATTDKMYTKIDVMPNRGDVAKSIIWNENTMSGILYLVNVVYHELNYNTKDLFFWIVKSFSGRTEKFLLTSPTDYSQFTHVYDPNSSNPQYKGTVPIVNTQFAPVYTDVDPWGAEQSVTKIYATKDIVPKFIDITQPGDKEKTQLPLATNLNDTNIIVSSNKTFSPIESIPDKISYVDPVTGEVWALSKSTSKQVKVYCDTESAWGDDYKYPVLDSMFSSTIVKDGITMTYEKPVDTGAKNTAVIFEIGYSYYYYTAIGGNYGDEGAANSAIPYDMVDLYDHFSDDGLGSLSGSRWRYSDNYAHAEGAASHMVWKDSIPLATYNAMIQDKWTDPTSGNGMRLYYHKIGATPGSPEAMWQADLPSYTNEQDELSSNRIYNQESYPYFHTINPNPKGLYWSRPVIMFYESTVVQSKYAGHYSYYDTDVTYIGYKVKFTGATPKDVGPSSYDGVGYYLGGLTRGVGDSNIEFTSVVNYEAIETYSGTLQHSVVKWDGTAYYEGIATKVNAVGNILPQGTDTLLAYPINNILTELNNNNEIESNLVYITDIFEKDVPLFYRYKLKYPIYTKTVPDQYGFYTGDDIFLVNSKNIPLSKEEYPYAVKITKVTDYVYDVYIYTSFIVTENFDINCIYSMYNATSLLIQPSYSEKIIVHPFMFNNKDYTMIPIDKNKGINNIKVNNPIITADSRHKLPFKYKVVTTDGVYNSNLYQTHLLNVEYAFDDELQYFRGNAAIISPITNTLPMSAYELVKRDCASLLVDVSGKYDETKLADLVNKTFEVLLDPLDADTNANLLDLNVFTDANGNSPVYAETSADTGFLNTTGLYTLMIELPSKYIILNDVIYPIYAIKCRDAVGIKVLQPREVGSFENWFPMIQYGHVNKEHEITDMKQVNIYTIPEYETLPFSKTYGRPCMDIIDETATILNETTIQVKNFPMYVLTDTHEDPINLIVKKVFDSTVEILDIVYWSFTEGIIKISNKISMNDTIKVTYTYEELSYKYKGFYDSNGNYVDLDLNPLQYHTYTDPRGLIYDRKPTYTLFNETIYFYLKPTVITDTGILSPEMPPVKSDNPFDTVPGYDLVTTRVLNVYPPVIPTITFTNWQGDTFTLPKSASVKMWMEQPNAENAKGYGKGYVYVDCVSIVDFNTNPLKYLKSSDGAYQYDVVFCGAWDCNNGYDLTPLSANAIIDFIVSGGGYINGHDTCVFGNHINFNLLMPYLNLSIIKLNGPYGHTEVEIEQSGLLTSFPWNIGDIGTKLEIPMSHTTGQFAKGLVWMKYTKNTAYAPNPETLTNDGEAGTNNFYLTTWNNTAMIQTGHSNGSATPDEQKVLGNVLMYLGANSNVHFIPKKYLSIVFIIDISGSMSDNIVSVVTEINNFISMVNSLGLTKVEIGLVMYNKVIGIESLSFTTGRFISTSQINEMINDINSIVFTDNSGETTMEAIQFAINKYVYSTLSKNIIFITDEEGDDNSKVYDTISLCESNNTNVIGIVNKTLTNKYLQLLVDNCNGSLFDINTSWSAALFNSLDSIIYTTKPPSYAFTQPNLGTDPLDVQPIVDTTDGINKINVYNSNTVYHKISDPTPDSADDIMIGKIFLRHNTSLKSTILVDARTRGGGILEDIADDLRKELEPESDFYFDIGYYDGEPYNENSVILVRLDNKLLQEYGGQLTHEQISDKVNKWVALGTYPIIEYVNTYSTDYCNNTVEIDEDVITNGSGPYVEAMVVNNLEVNETITTKHFKHDPIIVSTNILDNTVALYTDITIKPEE